jgi:Rab-GTPase-TBC domain
MTAALDPKKAHLAQFDLAPAIASVETERKKCREAEVRRKMSSRDLPDLQDLRPVRRPSDARLSTLRSASRLSRQSDLHRDSRDSLTPPKLGVAKVRSHESIRLATRQSLQFLTLGRDSTPGIPYEELPPGKPPIPITVAPRPSSARIENHPSFRQTEEPEEELEPLEGIQLSRPQEPERLDALVPHAFDGSGERPSKLRSDNRDPRRDSAIAVSDPNARNSHATFTTNTSDDISVSKPDSLPRMNGGTTEPGVKPGTPVKDEASTPTSSPKRARLTKKSLPDRDASSRSPEPFVGLTTDIPSISFDDLMEPEKMEFSKRGSMLIGGQRASEFRHIRGPSRPVNTPPAPSMVKMVPIREITVDEDLMSRRVRAMYASGMGDEMPAVPEGKALQNEPEEGTTAPTIRVVAETRAPAPTFTTTSLRGSVIREDHELAGGIEDWQDVEGGDVDRYGFISPKPPPGLGSTTSLPSAPSPQLHRISTQLQMASEQPRRANRLSRTPSGAKSHRSMQDMHSRPPKARPVSSQSSYRSTGSTGSRIRQATNKLPHNKQRRLLDEAGDMLTLPPGLAEVAAQADGGRTASVQKHKEWEREAKWRKMARMVRRDGRGGGMVFEFDTTNPKLISRTWKGIPDRWRATAWYAFLAASARRQRHRQPSDVELIQLFEELQEHASPDDGQIDTDVPRTIGAHIMFRARYRGGQRLLFRILHAVSLYFPQTGYVQGMAALAATLLCYYEEGMAFVMLVRLWTLRGLDRLYAAGFGGLMTALDELDSRWFVSGNIGTKLKDLGIAPTSYGTRWYLTLFNYSIPFPAQLRVWDVFFLLGDPVVPYPAAVTALNQAGPAASMSTPQESQWIGAKSKESVVAQPSSEDPSAQAVNTSATGSMTVVTNQNTKSKSKSKSKSKPAPPTAQLNSFHGGLDVLHATACALIDATHEILVDADFELAMRTLTSWIPVRDEDLLMKVARAEYGRHGGRKR